MRFKQSGVSLQTRYYVVYGDGCIEQMSAYIMLHMTNNYKASSIFGSYIFSDKNRCTFAL